jgi:large subunit ribosomal protein L17
MRHRVKKAKLGGRGRAGRKLLLGNLATSLILHEKIKTTKAKAKAVQPIIDKLIISAKKKEKRIAIREVAAILQNEMSSKKLFEELLKRYQDRQTGFTRISEIGFRAGDAAPLVQIELV